MNTDTDMDLDIVHIVSISVYAYVTAVYSCACPCPVCVLVPVMLVFMFMSMCEFYHAYFNGLVCQRTTFSAYNPGIAGNGELSALILTHSMDQNNRSYFLKVTCPALQSSR